MSGEPKTKKRSKREPTDEVGAKTRAALRPEVILEKGLKELVSVGETKDVILFASHAPKRKVEAIVDFLSMLRGLCSNAFDELNFIPLVHLTTGQKISRRNVTHMQDLYHRVTTATTTTKTLLDQLKFFASLGYAMRNDHRAAVEKRKAETFDDRDESEDDGDDESEEDDQVYWEQDRQSVAASGDACSSAGGTSRGFQQPLADSGSAAHSDQSEVETDVMPEAEDEGDDNDVFGDDDDDHDACPKLIESPGRFISPRPKSPKNMNCWGNKKQGPDLPSDEDEEDEMESVGDRCPAPPPSDDGVPDFEWIPTPPRRQAKPCRGGSLPFLPAKASDTKKQKLHSDF